jgi:hypothetical protein
MRRHTLVALLVLSGLALAALPGGQPQAVSAQTGQDRFVVFETFGRLA